MNDKTYIDAVPRESMGRNLQEQSRICIDCGAAMPFDEIKCPTCNNIRPRYRNQPTNQRGKTMKTPDEMLPHEKQIEIIRLLREQNELLQSIFAQLGELTYAVKERS